MGIRQRAPAPIPRRNRTLKSIDRHSLIRFVLLGFLECRMRIDNAECIVRFGGIPIQADGLVEFADGKGKLPARGGDLCLECAQVDIVGVDRDALVEQGHDGEHLLGRRGLSGASGRHAGRGGAGGELDLLPQCACKSMYDISFQDLQCHDIRLSGRVAEFFRGAEMGGFAVLLPGSAQHFASFHPCIPCHDKGFAELGGGAGVLSLFVQEACGIDFCMDRGGNLPDPGTQVLPLQGCPHAPDQPEEGQDEDRDAELACLLFFLVWFGRHGFPFPGLLRVPGSGVRGTLLRGNPEEGLKAFLLSWYYILRILQANSCRENGGIAPESGIPGARRVYFPDFGWFFPPGMPMKRDRDRHRGTDAGLFRFPVGWRGLFMKRILLLVLLGMIPGFRNPVSASDPHPELAAMAEVPLRFWGIGISEFHAERPSTISISDTGGHLNYYWYWPFKFRVRTNLEELDTYIEERMPSLVDDQARINFQNYQRMIRETLQEAKHLPVYIVTHTEQGQILPDTSNRVIRNAIERKVGRRLQTVKEIAEMDLHTVEATRDPDHGMGKWVYGVAIFDAMDPKTRMFDILVYGMGRRIVPHYEPGHVLFPVDQLHRDNALNPSLRRCFRYKYHRIGQSGFPQLNTIQSLGRAEEWVWLWPPQIYVGKARTIQVQRRSGLGLERPYLYVPYRIWNNTNDVQNLDVVRAGLVQDVTWRGEPVRLTMYDIGEADSLWKTQAMRIIREEVESGAAGRFALEHETDAVQVDRNQLIETYRRWSPGPDSPMAYETQTVEYIPTDRHEVSNPQELDMRLRNNALLKEALEAMEERRRADARAKADLLPTEEDRQFKGNIPPGKFVRGLIVTRQGVEDLDAVIDALIARLQTHALTGIASENRPLLAAYLGIRPENPNPERLWEQPPEPSRDEICQLLIRLASEDLAAAGGVVTEEDQHRYGENAPIGAYLNHLAMERMRERASENLIDTFFEVRWDGVIDRAAFVTNFKRPLPEERDPTRRHTTPLSELIQRQQELEAADRPDAVREEVEEEDPWGF